jgi:hypothetical protein
MSWNGSLPLFAFSLSEKGGRVLSLSVVLVVRRRLFLTGVSASLAETVGDKFNLEFSQAEILSFKSVFPVFQGLSHGRGRTRGRTHESAVFLHPVQYSIIGCPRLMQLGDLSRDNLIDCCRPIAVDDRDLVLSGVGDIK